MNLQSEPLAKLERIVRLRANCACRAFNLGYLDVGLIQLHKALVDAERVRMLQRAGWETSKHGIQGERA